MTADATFRKVKPTSRVPDVCGLCGDNFLSHPSNKRAHGLPNLCRKCRVGDTEYAKALAQLKGEPWLPSFEELDRKGII